jgi:lipoic acid synthetase
MKTKPEWLNKKIDFHAMREMGAMLRSLSLHTVCEGAKCPNMGECFRNKTATFLILGDVCTRNCRFCAISTGKPLPPDENEPENLAKAALTLGLKHVVITSVTRDDLADGGAEQFAKCVEELKKALPESTVEVLIPDFKGDEKALDIVINASPLIINHNVETVPNLYKIARPQANYQRSLDVLNYVKRTSPHIYTKTGIMVGLGETESEVFQLIDDVASINCDMLTIGQYLPPSNLHANLKEYVSPEQFEKYKIYAEKKGIKHCSSSAYVRSSYNALQSVNAVVCKI